LQLAWRKHGPIAFDFVVLETSDDLDALPRLEAEWCLRLRPFYNVTAPDANAQWRLAPETIEKKKLFRPSPQHLAIIRSIWRGRRHSEATLAKMRSRKVSAATRVKMSRPKAPEHVAKVAAALRGKSRETWILRRMLLGRYRKHFEAIRNAGQLSLFDMENGQ
jgi:hypothetical protein